MNDSGVRRTSVMLEIDEDVYSTLVEPLKKNKRFARLVASLLKAYLADSYIQSVVDDTFEGVRKAVVDGFADSVSSMESALVNMGLLTDELKAASMTGHRKFSEGVEQNSPAQPVESDPTPDVGKLEKRLSTLEDTVSSGFERILSMLSSANVCPSAVNTPSQPTALVVPEVQDLEDDGEAEFAVTDETAGSEGAVSEEASAFLADLMADFGSVF